MIMIIQNVMLLHEDYNGDYHNAMVSKLHLQTVVSEFDSHRLLILLVFDKLS